MSALLKGVLSTDCMWFVCTLPFCAIVSSGSRAPGGTICIWDACNYYLQLISRIRATVQAPKKNITSMDFALLALADIIVAFELVISNIYWSSPGPPTIYQHRQSVRTIYIEDRFTLWWKKAEMGLAVFTLDILGVVPVTNYYVGEGGGTNRSLYIDPRDFKRSEW